MKVKEIQHDPCYGGEWFHDYNLSTDILEEKWIKNWIDNLQIIGKPEQIKARITKEGQLFTRVRFDEEGTITDVSVGQRGPGTMCDMAYSDIDRIVPIIIDCMR